MRPQKQYRVCSRQTGNFIVDGTARQCAAVLNISIYGFRDALYRSQTAGNSKYRIEEILDESQTKAPHPELLEAANAWDAFMEPIRKAYGIPVYQSVKEQ